MQVNILYFGKIRDITGKDSENMPLNTLTNVYALKEFIENKYPGIEKVSYSIAVDQTIVPDDFIIETDADIALLPPFAGG
jgi:sulfur-carrier protein